MTVTHIDKDADTLTMTITSEFDAPLDRVWDLWANPRQLEWWWGPPTYPATVVDHHLTPGGRVTYFMTGPEGDTPRGWWRILTVDPPRGLEFEDGFADESGEPNPNMPVMTIRVTLDEQPGGTRMAVTTRFPSLEAMEQLLAMGAEEGMREAMGQIDEVLRTPVPAS
jgi:uncharacterized protein YndB with AHSA1/START domain